jgi:hypothetical protein
MKAPGQGGQNCQNHDFRRDGKHMFGIEGGWYLALAIGAMGSFIVVLGSVHIWSNLGSAKKK